MSDLRCAAPVASIDLTIDNQPTADAGADGDVEDRGEPLAGAEEGFSEAGAVGVVAEDGGELDDVADPVGEGEVVPAFDLVGFDDGVGGVIHGSAEADADA